MIWYDPELLRGTNRRRRGVRSVGHPLRLLPIRSLLSPTQWRHSVISIHALLTLSSPCKTKMTEHTYTYFQPVSKITSYSFHEVYPKLRIGIPPSRHACPSPLCRCTFLPRYLPGLRLPHGYVHSVASRTEFLRGRGRGRGKSEAGSYIHTQAHTSQCSVRTHIHIHRCKINTLITTLKEISTGKAVRT